jgi:hypothetical protein
MLTHSEPRPRVSEAQWWLSSPAVFCIGKNVNGHGSSKARGVDESLAVLSGGGDFGDCFGHGIVGRDDFAIFATLQECTGKFLVMDTRLHQGNNDVVDGVQHSPRAPLVGHESSTV